GLEPRNDASSLGASIQVMIVLGRQIRRRIGQVGLKMQQVREARRMSFRHLDKHAQWLPNRKLYGFVGNNDFAVKMSSNCLHKQFLSGHSLRLHSSSLVHFPCPTLSDG